MIQLKLIVSCTWWVVEHSFIYIQDIITKIKFCMYYKFNFNLLWFYINLVFLTLSINYKSRKLYYIVNIVIFIQNDKSFLDSKRTIKCMFYYVLFTYILFYTK